MAFATGTVGLLALGLMMVTVTPNRSDAPVAISSSTTPTAASSSALRANPSVPEVRAIRTASPVLATPIGDGTFAVVTRASLVDLGSSVIDVRLPSGRQSLGSIVTASRDTVIVALATVEGGHPIAAERPLDDEIVTVLASPPITVAFDDVGDLAVEEGTAVVDDDGELVGICSRSGNGMRLIEVSAELDAATSVVP